MDASLGRVYAAVRRAGGGMIITADHGNAEVMIDPVTGGPHTYHTTNPVPLVLVSSDAHAVRWRDDGSLRDIAPTLLGIAGIPLSAEMTGHDLRIPNGQPAETGEPKRNSVQAEKGDPGRFSFPRPMTNRPGLDFSFSGLKTHTATAIRELAVDAQAHADVAAGFQQAVVDTLTIKCRRALEQTGLTRLVVAGGVSANQALRLRLDAEAAQHGWSVYYPGLAYCTDNGAMVAYAGCQRLLAGQHDDLAVRAIARWPMASLTAID